MIYRDRIAAVIVAIVVIPTLAAALWVLGRHDTDTARREEHAKRATAQEQRADDLQVALDGERFARGAEAVAAAHERARLEEEVRVLAALLEQQGGVSPITPPAPAGGPAPGGTSAPAPAPPAQSPSPPPAPPTPGPNRGLLPDDLPILGPLL